jgi:hypothetical protein
MLAVTAVAALAYAVGVDFEIPEGGEAIPVPGFATMTSFFSLVGVAIAAGLRRWSARPALRFVQTAVALTALSLLAPVLSGGDAATVVALICLHLVAAAVMIPALAR